MLLQGKKVDWLEYLSVRKRSRFRKDSVVLTGEDIAQSACIVLEGKVRMVLCAPDGRQRTVGYLTDGSIFGEVAALGRQPLNASIIMIADTDCTIGYVSVDDILSTLSEHVDLLPDFLRGIGEKTSAFLEEVSSVAFGTVRAQVATLLQVLSADKHYVDISHEKLAQLAGRTRVTVTAHLRGLERLQAVRLERSRISILDSEILSHAASDHSHP